MSTTALAAAFGLGLAGSLHCAAMCGPIAVAGTCPQGQLSRRDAAGYFLGRAFAYVVGGALFGSLGHSVHHALMGVHTPVLVTLAIGLFLYGLRQLHRARRPPPEQLVQLRTRRAALWSFLAALLPSRGLGLGLATGILPCGMLMGAWMISASTRSPTQGAVTMAVFSIASLPGLVGPLFARRALTGLVDRAVRLLGGGAGPAGAPAVGRARALASGLLWCALALWIGARPFLMAGHGGH